MRKRGLEPLRPKTLDPKSNAATNYATCAFADAKIAKNPACAKYNATCYAWRIGRVAVGLPHGGEAGTFSSRSLTHPGDLSARMCQASVWGARIETQAALHINHIIPQSRRSACSISFL